MATEKQRESAKKPRSETVSASADFWIRQFVNHLEAQFLDASRGLAPDAHLRDYQAATIRAVYQTLLESGMSADELAEAIGQVSIEHRPKFTEWNADLNQRRFELIDKEIQETLTPVEKIELAGLTRIMRGHVDSETNLPLAGARALHRKLLEMDVTDRPR